MAESPEPKGAEPLMRTTLGRQCWRSLFCSTFLSTLVLAELVLPVLVLGVLAATWSSTTSF